MRPADRVTRERVAAYVAEMQTELAPYSVLCRIRELYDALRVMEPQSNWKWLGATPPELESPSPSGARQALPPEAAGRPDGAWRTADGRSRSGYGTVGETTRHPLPRRPDDRLAGVPAGAAQEPRDDAAWPASHEGGRLWRIVFAAEETKTHVPYEAVLPAALGPRLERYLDVYRPVLLGVEQAARQSRRPANSSGTSTRSGCRKTESSSAYEAVGIPDRLPYATGVWPQRLPASVSRLRRDRGRRRQPEAHWGCFA